MGILFVCCHQCNWQGGIQGPKEPVRGERGDPGPVCAPGRAGSHTPMTWLQPGVQGSRGEAPQQTGSETQEREHQVPGGHPPSSPSRGSVHTGNTTFKQRGRGPRSARLTMTTNCRKSPVPRARGQDTEMTWGGQPSRGRKEHPPLRPPPRDQVQNPAGQ